MQEFVVSFSSWFSSLFDLLNSYSFRVFGFSASLLHIFTAFILISIVISVFWKGARG